MNEFDKILWGFIFSAVGIAFGWTLNQFGQWIRTRQDDKKDLKVVLFNLLEAYFIFVRSDLDKFVQKVTDKVHEKMPQEQQTQESKAYMNTIYSGFASSYLKPELSDELKVIRQNYQDSIKTLAKIDPITAYYLNGKTNILDSFDTIQEWFESLKTEFPTEQNEIELGSKQAVNILKPDILNDTLSDLEKDIRNIAWKINPYLWIKSLIAIKRLRTNANERLDKEIDKLLEKLTPLFDSF